LVGSPDAASRLAALRSAALADEDGARLRAKLDTMETELGKALAAKAI
jgi:indolepyruvate ferredoxin oxidoreductase, beta subunit